MKKIYLLLFIPLLLRDCIALQYKYYISHAKEFAILAGIYPDALIADGKEVDVKRMILTE